MSAYVLLIAGSTAISGLLFGYDTAVINGALVYLKSHFQLSPVATELTATVLLWGCAVGAGLAGYVSDRFGRRVVLFSAGILFCSSALGAAFANQLWHLLAARLIGGLAIGCASLIAPLYIAEIAPARVRGLKSSVVIEAALVLREHESAALGGGDPGKQRSLLWASGAIDWCGAFVCGSMSLDRPCLRISDRCRTPRN